MYKLHPMVGKIHPKGHASYLEDRFSCQIASIVLWTVVAIITGWMMHCRDSSTFEKERYRKWGKKQVTSFCPTVKISRWSLHFDRECNHPTHACAFIRPLSWSIVTVMIFDLKSSIYHWYVFVYFDRLKKIDQNLSSQSTWARIAAHKEKMTKFLRILGHMIIGLHGYCPSSIWLSTIIAQQNESTQHYHACRM